MNEKQGELRDRIERLCLLKGRTFRLSTGALSDYYFDCKRATLHGDTLQLITEEFIARIQELPLQPSAVAGLTLGADPLVAAIIIRAKQLGLSIVHGSIVRKERKQHGTESKIENDPEPGTRVVVVDDVITRGGSIASACRELIAAGCEVVGIVAVIDREEGGVEHLRESYRCPVHTIFKKSEFRALAQDDSITARGKAALGS